jgi:hypothetical protein
MTQILRCNYYTDNWSVAVRTAFQHPLAVDSCVMALVTLYGESAEHLARYCNDC